MGFFVRPDGLIASIEDFDAEGAAARGIAAVFSDLDNTLARWNDPVVPPGALAFADRLRAQGIDLCIVSNNSEARIHPFAQAIGAQYIAKAHKPLPFALRAWAKSANLPGNRCMMLGDQLLTDIIAGNLAGMSTCLVKPIDLSREFRGTKVNRAIEKVLYRILGITWEGFS